MLQASLLFGLLSNLKMEAIYYCETSADFSLRFVQKIELFVGSVLPFFKIGIVGGGVQLGGYISPLV
jgi:hypothetical protein